MPEVNKIQWWMHQCKCYTSYSQLEYELKQHSVVTHLYMSGFILQNLSTVTPNLTHLCAPSLSEELAGEIHKAASV